MDFGQPATYGVPRPLHIHSESNNRSACIIQQDAVVTLLRIVGSGANFVKISDLTFRLNGRHAISSDTSSIRLENVDIVRAGPSGTASRPFLIDTAVAFEADNCTFSSGLPAGIETDATGYAAFTNCVFRDATNSGQVRGGWGGLIFAEACNSLTFTHCKFLRGTSQFGGCVYAEASTSIKFIQSEFDSCHAAGPTLDVITPGGAIGAQVRRHYWHEDEFLDLMHFLFLFLFSFFFFFFRLC
jgi:hypothetical protein